MEKHDLSVTFSRYAGVRAIVTGASGFIGRRVAQYLSRAGADLVMAARDPSRMRSLADELAIRGSIVQLDLRDHQAIEALFRSTRPQVTFNLAGYGVDRNETDPEAARLINVGCVEWLADAVASWGDLSWAGPHLIHAGSAQEYGLARGRLDEDGPVRPTTPYGQTKLEGTLALGGRATRGELRALTARLFTVYGPGEHPSRLLPSLMRAAELKQRIALTEGTQRRDFTYVGDVAEGLLRLGAAETAPWCVVNLATGGLTTVREFVEIAASVLGLSRELLAFGAMQAAGDEMEHDEVSIHRLQGILDWQPRTPIVQGVGLTLGAKS